MSEHKHTPWWSTPLHLDHREFAYGRVLFLGDHELFPPETLEVAKTAAGTTWKRYELIGGTLAFGRCGECPAARPYIVQDVLRFLTDDLDAARALFAENSRLLSGEDSQL